MKYGLTCKKSSKISWLIWKSYKDDKNEEFKNVINQAWRPQETKMRLQFN